MVKDITLPPRICYHKDFMHHYSSKNGYNVLDLMICNECGERIEQEIFKNNNHIIVVKKENELINWLKND